MSIFSIFHLFKPFISLLAMGIPSIFQDGFVAIAVETLSMQDYTILDIQSYLASEGYSVATEDIEVFLEHCMQN